jgi:hypothetical protein
MGHDEHARRTLAASEKGYSKIFRLFLKAKLTPEVEHQFKMKFKDLRERLDALQQSVKTVPYRR